MANIQLVAESGRCEQTHTLLADESLSPAFRGFIEMWARKIQGAEQRSPGMGMLEESHAPAQ
jgi:hypothetical protein